MKSIVELDFLEANQIVAALETREEYLARHAAPDDRVAAQAVANCLAAELTIRAAFRLTERELDAQHEANMRDLDALALAERLPEIALAMDDTSPQLLRFQSEDR